MNKYSIEERKNLLAQNYFTSKTSFVICIDITDINPKEQIFCAIDLAARNIVGHCFKDTPFEVDDIICVIEQIVKDRDFLPRIQILHSDRATLRGTTLFLIPSI